MKKLACILALGWLVGACTDRPRGHVYRCVIVDIQSRHLYGGIIPDLEYVVITDCGYTLYTTRGVYRVGDTVEVEVIRN